MGLWSAPSRIANSQSRGVALDREASRARACAREEAVGVRDERSSGLTPPRSCGPGRRTRASAAARLHW